MTKRKMKTFKFLAVLFAALTFGFAVVSCGDDDDILKPNQNINSERGVSDIAVIDSELSFGMWETHQGIKLTATLFFGFNSAEEITSMRVVYNCKDAGVLDEMYEAETKNGYEVKRGNNELICIAPPSEYEGWTVQVIKAYRESLLEKLKKGENLL